MNTADRVRLPKGEFTASVRYWLLIGFLMAFLDVVFSPRVHQFVSWEAVFGYSMMSSGFYLACSIALCMGITVLSATWSRTPRTSGRRLIALFLAGCLFLVIVRATSIEYSLPRDALQWLFLVLAASLAVLSAIALSRCVIWIGDRRILLVGILLFLNLASLYRLRPIEVPPASRESSGGKTPCDIILILIDTLRSDFLGCYGNRWVRTPNMDRLAGEGIRFENVISQSSWTKSSIASLFTSRYPSDHGVRGAEDSLSPELTCLPERLRMEGYLTAGINTNPWLDSHFGFDRGFDVYLESFPGFDDLFFVDLLARRGLVVRPPFVSGDIVFSRAVDLIKRLRDRPFFLYVHVMDVHDPYVPPRPFDHIYDDSVCGPPGEGGPSAGSRIPRDELDHLEAAVCHDMHLYAGEVTYVDSLIGEFRKRLTALERGRDFILIVTADHGEAFSEHGVTGHGKNLYGEVLKVPLILFGPRRLPSGRTVTPLVRLVDLFPTLLDIVSGRGAASSAVYPPYRGRSLEPLWESGPGGEDGAARPGAISELYYRRQNVVSVTTPLWKLILDRNAVVEPGDTGLELYDITADPGEANDLSGARVDILTALMDLVPKDATGSGPVREGTTLPADIRERLQALGYL